VPITAPHIFAITLSQIIYFLPLICFLNKYYLADQNKDAMGEVSGTYGGKEGRGLRQGFVEGELEGNRPLERIRHRWESNIEIDLQVIV
jgi:hypothetical protein